MNNEAKKGNTRLHTSTPTSFSLILRIAIRDGWRDVCENVFEGKPPLCVLLPDNTLLKLHIQNHSHYAFAGKRAFFDGAGFGALRLLLLPSTTTESEDQLTNHESPTHHVSHPNKNNDYHHNHHNRDNINNTNNAVGGMVIIQLADASPLYEHLESKVELAKYMRREQKQHLIPTSRTFRWDVNLRANEILQRGWYKNINIQQPHVLKYDGSSSGNDVFFVTSFDEVVQRVEENAAMQAELPFLSEREDAINGWVLQRFVTSGRFINERKFHLRVYCVVNKRKVYIYRHYEVRLAEEKYQHGVYDRATQISNGRGGLHGRRLLAHHVEELSDIIDDIKPFVYDVMFPLSLRRHWKRRNELNHRFDEPSSSLPMITTMNNEYSDDDDDDNDNECGEDECISAERRRFMPSLCECSIDGRSTEYDYGADERFIVDQHSDNENVRCRLEEENSNVENEWAKRCMQSMRCTVEDWHQFAFIAHDIMVDEHNRLVLLETNHCPSSPPSNLGGEFGDHLECLMRDLFVTLLFGSNAKSSFSDSSFSPSLFEYLGKVKL